MNQTTQTQTVTKYFEAFYKDGQPAKRSNWIELNATTMEQAIREFTDGVILLLGSKCDAGKINHADRNYLAWEDALSANPDICINPVVTPEMEELISEDRIGYYDLNGNMIISDVTLKAGIIQFSYETSNWYIESETSLVEDTENQ